MEFTTEKRKLVHETLDVEYTSYLPADSDTVRGDVDDTSFLTGSDYASVYVTSNESDIQTFLGMLDESDIEALVDNIGSDEIIVFEVADYFILFTDSDSLRPEVNEFVHEHMICFGAEMDDVAIHDCDLASMLVHDLEMDFEAAKEMYDEGTCTVDGDDDEEYEATLDALCRIAEYNIENGHSWDYIVQFIIDFVRVVEVNDL